MHMALDVTIDPGVVASACNLMSVREANLAGCGDPIACGTELCTCVWWGGSVQALRRDSNYSPGADPTEV